MSYVIHTLSSRLLFAYVGDIRPMTACAESHKTGSEFLDRAGRVRRAMRWVEGCQALDDGMMERDASRRRAFSLQPRSGTMRQLWPRGSCIIHRLRA